MATLSALPWLVPLVAVTAAGLLAVYHLSYRDRGRRVKPLYVVLAVFQVAQYATTSRALWPDAAGSPSVGSAVLFPAVLMLILTIYVRKDVFEFYRVCQWLLWVNLGLAVAAALFGVIHRLGDGQFVAELTGVMGFRRLILGTGLLLADVYLMAWVFDRTPGTGRVPRLVLPLVAALAADAVGYGAVLWWVRGDHSAAALGGIVTAQLAGKAVAAAVTAGLLYAYLWWFDPEDLSDPPRGMTRWQFARSLLWLPPVRWVLPPAARRWAYRSQLFPLDREAGVGRAEWANFPHLVLLAARELDRFSLLAVRVPADRGDWLRRVVDPLVEWSRRKRTSGWLATRPDGMVFVLLPGVGRTRASQIADQFHARYLDAFRPDGSARVACHCHVQERTGSPMATTADLLLDRLAAQTDAPASGLTGGAGGGYSAAIINLPAELVAALDAAPGGQVRAVDPGTGRVYVLTATPADPPPGTGGSHPADPPPGIRAAQEAFWKDLGRLQRDRKTTGKWVLYRRTGLVAASHDPAELYRRIRPADWPDVYLGRAEPREQPPWVPEEVDVPDRSLGGVLAPGTER